MEKDNDNKEIQVLFNTYNTYESKFTYTSKYVHYVNNAYFHVYHKPFNHDTLQFDPLSWDAMLNVKKEHKW